VVDALFVANPSALPMIVLGTNIPGILLYDASHVGAGEVRGNEYVLVGYCASVLAFAYIIIVLDVLSYPNDNKKILVSVAVV
jgi:hypothetical protein